MISFSVRLPDGRVVSPGVKTCTWWRYLQNGRASIIWLHFWIEKKMKRLHSWGCYLPKHSLRYVCSVVDLLLEMIPLPFLIKCRSLQTFQRKVPRTVCLFVPWPAHYCCTIKLRGTTHFPRQRFYNSVCTSIEKFTNSGVLFETVWHTSIYVYPSRSLYVNKRKLVILLLCWSSEKPPFSFILFLVLPQRGTPIQIRRSLTALKNSLKPSRCGCVTHTSISEVNFVSVDFNQIRVT